MYFWRREVAGRSRMERIRNDRITEIMKITHNDRWYLKYTMKARRKWQSDIDDEAWSGRGHGMTEMDGS